MTLTYPLSLVSDHLFVTLPSGRWLLDTGASHSLGPPGARVALADRSVETHPSYLGASLPAIQSLVGVPFQGLIGLDLLAQLDLVFDLPAGNLHVSTEPGLSSVDGQVVSLLGAPQGIPQVQLQTRGAPYTWWIDTGAKLSYFQPRQVLRACAPAGTVEDFFPVYGRFQVSTYRVPVDIGSVQLTVQAGQLPQALAPMLTHQRIDGILGAELFRDRPVGIFPRRQQLVVW